MKINWFVVGYFAVTMSVGFVVAFAFAYAMTAITGSPYVVAPVCR